MNAVQHVEAAADAMLDARPGLAEWHIARAELLAGRTGRTVVELVDEFPHLEDVAGIVAPTLVSWAVASA